MNEIAFLLVPLLILWAWLLPIGLTNRRIEGSILQIRSIPALARVKRHTLPHALAAIAATTLAALDLASPWWIVVVLASFATIVAVPQRYVVTTRGIRTGRGSFRRWTEFAGVHRSKAGVTLQTIGRLPDVPIWLSRSRGDDEFVHLLRTLVRDSYKGKMTSFPVTQSPARPQLDPPEIPDVAAFKR